jgi:hypothetical protein
MARASRERHPSSRALQKDGLIAARRGHIQVLDKPAMEARVCECYEVVRKEYERLLPPVPDADLAEK